MATGRSESHHGGTGHGVNISFPYANLEHFGAGSADRAAVCGRKDVFCVFRPKIELDTNIGYIDYDGSFELGFIVISCRKVGQIRSTSFLPHNARTFC